MLVLSLDCTAKSVSAAVAEDGKLLAEGFLNINLTHSETLLPLCEQLLKNARISLSDIDAFAVTAGPGSFTGVRIGISAVKGMAFAKDTPVFSFSALEAMALAFEDIAGLNGIICGLMDARCNQFYNALFSVKNGKINRLTEDRVIVSNRLSEELESNFKGENIILAGDGARLFYKNAEEKDLFKLAPETHITQRAAGIALKASVSKAEDAVTPDKLMPVYLRKSQAEREKEAREKQKA